MVNLFHIGIEFILINNNSMAYKKLSQKEFDLVSNLIYEDLNREIRTKRLQAIETFELPEELLKDITMFFELQEKIAVLTSDKTALHKKLSDAIRKEPYNGIISLANIEKTIQCFKEAMVKTTYPDLKDIQLQLLRGGIENLDETINKITQVMKEKLNLI